jgi:sugar lactone lactonase YvrE
MNLRVLPLAAVTALAACSAGGPSSPLTSAPTNNSIVHADAAHCPTSVVYVVTNRSSIAIYDSAHLQAGPCGTIDFPSAPQGVFVDSHANLWVADSAARAIYRFAPRSGSPAVTLSDPNGVPNAVAVDDASNTVYVSEYKNDTNPQTVVEVYENGSTTPTRTLSDPDGRNGGYVAVDRAGNVYATLMTQANTAQVDRWMGGTGSPQNLGLKLIGAGGIVTTATGALAVCDRYHARCGEFLPGSKSMSHVFAHMGTGIHIGPVPNKPPWLFPDALALDRAENRAYVVATTFSKWAYPGPDRRPNHLPLLELKVPGDAGQGIAVNPPSKPGKPYN